MPQQPSHETVSESCAMRSHHRVLLQIKQELPPSKCVTRIAAALLFTLALGAATLLAPATATANPVETTAVVVRVVDGDTIDIHNNNQEHQHNQINEKKTTKNKKQTKTKKKKTTKKHKNKKKKKQNKRKLTPKSPLHKIIHPIDYPLP